MKTSMKYIQAFMFMLAISMVPRTMAATDVLESPEDVMPESIMPIEVEPEAPAESGCGLMGALRSLFRPMFAVDIHDTQVDIGSPVPDDPNSFLVTVSRVDQLFDGYNGGEFMGKRLQSVRLSFDVIDNVLHCNGQPVIEGISNMKVKKVDCIFTSGTYLLYFIPRLKQKRSRSSLQTIWNQRNPFCPFLTLVWWRYSFKWPLKKWFRTISLFDEW